MAKRHLDLEGAKAPKLELDFLRLHVAVTRIRERGERAQGFLAVTTEKIASRVGRWIDKYQTTDTVQLHIMGLSDDELRAMELEVRANREGMIAGATGSTVLGKSCAQVGGDIGERKLREIIKKHAPSVEEVDDPRRLPLGVRWDFYGVLDT